MSKAVSAEGKALESFHFQQFYGVHYSIFISRDLLRTLDGLLDLVNTLFIYCLLSSEQEQSIPFDSSPAPFLDEVIDKFVLKETFFFCINSIFPRVEKLYGTCSIYRCL